MNTLDVDGHFWLTETPDDKVLGHLRYDATSGASLELMGSLHKVRASGTVYFAHLMEHDPVRIHGFVGSRPVTLDECIRTNLTIGSMPMGEKYQPGIIFDGIHFDSDEIPLFGGFQTRLRHIINWIGKSGVSVVIDRDKNDSIRSLTASVVPLESMVARTAIGELEVSYGYRIRGDRIAATEVNQDCKVELRFANPRRLEHVLRACAALQQIVTIGVDAPVAFSSVDLLPVQTTCTAGQERNAIDTIRLYKHLPGNDLPTKPKSVPVSKMLFTFDDIGGMKGLAAWLATANEIEPVVGLLTSHWYMPTLYVENRFFNAITAAETLQRIRTNKQMLDFHKMLKGLASEAGEIFQKLVGNVDSWAKLVRDTRVKRVVHRGLHESGDVDGVYWLAESVYFLLVLCLLRQCGVPETTLAGIRNRGRFVQLSKQIQRLA